MTGKEKNSFYEEVSGSTSIITLIRKAINRILLWDIPSLEDYFPIAQEIFGKNEQFGNGETVSTVNTVNAVRLINKKSLKESVEEFKSKRKNRLENFKSYVEGEEIMVNSYCGFDIVSTIANAGSFARLQAIQHTSVLPSQYIREVCNKYRSITKYNRFRGYLYSYPFSLFICDFFIRRGLLKDYYKYDYDEKGKTGNYSLRIKGKQAWSKVAYQSHLELIAAYMREGLTIKAKKIIEFAK